MTRLCVFSRLRYHYDDRLPPLFRKIADSHCCIEELAYGGNGTLLWLQLSLYDLGYSTRRSCTLSSTRGCLGLMLGLA